MPFNTASLQDLFVATQTGGRSQRQDARRTYYNAMTPLQRRVELAQLTEQIHDWSMDMNVTLDWSIGENTRANLLQDRRDLEWVMAQKGESRCLHAAQAISQFMPVI